MPRKARALVVSLAALALCACSTTTPSTPLTRASRPAASPTARWRIDLPDEPGAISADSLGSVVIAGDRHVVALGHDGKQQWRATIDDLGIQYPALDRDLVVVSTVVDAGSSTTGAFIALDRATGRQRWRVEVDGEPGPVTLTPMTVFAATDNGGVFAFGRNGERRWKKHEAATISSRGSIAYDEATATIGVVVFVARRGWLLVLLHAEHGDDAGGFDLGAGDPPSAVVAAGPGRFVLGDGETHELLVIDLRARAIASAVRTGGGFDPANQPVTDGDFAAIVDGHGTVTAADLRLGRVIWQHALGGSVLDARPQLSADAVVVSTFAGPISVLSRADGRPVHSPAERLDGVPVGFAITSRLLVVAMRFADPGRVEAWPVP